MSKQRIPGPSRLLLSAAIVVGLTAASAAHAVLMDASVVVNDTANVPPAQTSGFNGFQQVKSDQALPADATLQAVNLRYNLTLGDTVGARNCLFFFQNGFTCADEVFWNIGGAGGANSAFAPIGGGSLAENEYEQQTMDIDPDFAHDNNNDQTRPIAMAMDNVKNFTNLSEFDVLGQVPGFVESVFQAQDGFAAGDLTVWNYGAEFTLTYTYETADNGGGGPHPNPAPATLALLGLGIAGLGIRRRSRVS